MHGYLRSDQSYAKICAVSRVTKHIFITESKKVRVVLSVEQFIM
jgi:hypothetical protein